MLLNMCWGNNTKYSKPFIFRAFHQSHAEVDMISSFWLNPKYDQYDLGDFHFITHHIKDKNVFLSSGQEFSVNQVWEVMRVKENKFTLMLNSS